MVFNQTFNQTFNQAFNKIKVDSDGLDHVRTQLYQSRGRGQL